MSTSPSTFELSALTLEEWRSLRVYQDLYQLLLSLIHDQGLVLEEGSERATDEALKAQALSRLKGPPRQLLDLTFEELIQQLLDAHWIRRVDERLSLSKSFERRVTRLLDGHDPFEQPKPNLVKPKAPQRRPEVGLEYVDLFAHVSEEDDTLFTARHLDRVVSSLDGLTLLLSGLYELISFSDDLRFPELLDAMERALLLKREGEFIKLDLHGAQIARVERTERLKQLGVIAERMRRDLTRRR